MDQNMQSAPQENLGNVLVKKLGLVLSVFVFLLPVFFVPAVGVNLYVAKITLLATGLVAVFAIFLSSVLSTGLVEVPKVRYLLPIGLFAVVSLVSSIFSGAISSSIVGSVFDLGTSGSILMLVFALFMVVVSVKNTGVASKVISAFIYSSIFLAAYTLLGTFGFSLLPTSLASRMPLFLTGGIVDTAIVFGAAVILALCAINMTDISKRTKYILSVLMAFAILFIGAANFRPVVVILGLVSLVFFVYILSWSVGRRDGVSQEGENASADNKISLSSLAVLIASVVLLLGGSGISNYLSQAMRVQSVEIRPNFETTMNLTLSSWKQNFALGVGPNRFAEFWALHKPAEINQTQFWNSDFYTGSGFIPTVAITTGLLGVLSLLAFFVLYVLIGVKAIFAQANSGRSRYLSASSFLVSLYFWIILFLYTPSVTVMALTFIFTGLFTATLVPQGIAGLWKVNIFSNPKTNFLSVLSIVVLLIVSVAGGYFVWEKTIATVVFERGIISYQKTGDLNAAKESTAKAISMMPSDIYWRGLTEISLLDLGRVLGGITDQNQLTDSVQAEVQKIIANSIESAKKAVERNDRNFQNWFVLGRVYEVMASNGIQGALESAKSAYAEAATRSPGNPSVPLALARLNALSGDVAAARENIAKALELKNNYTDAYFTLAQLEIAANNIPAASRSVEAATIVDPTNAGLYFQLGLLKYNQKDYAGAANAMEKATALVADYANAKYFLGLSYYQIGKKAESIKQFEDIIATNPDNQDVKAVLNNLKAGKAPFPNAATTDKSKPPVEEN